MRDITRWSDQSEADPQDTLSDVDWYMFLSNSSDISEFTADMVTSFIAMLGDTIVPTVS